MLRRQLMRAISMVMLATPVAAQSDSTHRSP